MSRLIRKIIIYIAAFFLIASGIIYMGISLKPAYFLAAPSDYVIAKYQYQQATTPAAFRNIIIGDSRGNSDINPLIMGDNWIDLCIPGSEYVEGYLTLKHYLAVNKVDTLIMFYGIESFHDDGLTFFDVRTIPWQLPSADELETFEGVEKKLNSDRYGTSSLSRMKLQVTQFRRRLRYFHFPLSYRETFIDGLGSFFNTASKDKIKQIQATIKDNRGHINFGELDSCDSISLKNLDRTLTRKPLQLAYLDSIMSLCEKKHIHAYLIIPPMNQATYDAYKHSVFRTSVDSLVTSAITEKYPALIYLHDPVSMPNSLFGDPWHLNKKGTIIYSNRLRELLK